MQEEEKQTNEGQPAPEPQPASESELDAGSPEPQTPPPLENEAGQSQPEQEPQPPPTAPTPLPSTAQQKRRQYFLSLGSGFIPVIVLLVTFGIGVQQGQNGLGTLIFGGILAIVLYIVELILTIIFLSIRGLRFAGYGLLTAFLVTPIVAAIGCTAIPTLIHP